jgi:PAS domain S-box-containing protein
MRLILQSLFKEDPSILTRLAQKRDEMGRIANLIEIFFQQRQQLVDEIGTRKRAEDELRKEKELSESIINTAQVILLLLDSRGRILKCNPYMEQITGYKFEEVKGRSWVETFVPADIRVRIHELMLSALSGTQTRGSVNAIIAKDGHEIQIEWYDKTIKDVNGNIEGLLSIGVDVTERKRLEEEARKRLQELEVFYKASMGREERILELKKEIEGLKEELGK